MTTSLDQRQPEPPAAIEDILLAEFLDEALARMSRGEPVSAPDLLAAAPHLVSAGQTLIQNVHALLALASQARDEEMLLESEWLELSSQQKTLPREATDKLPDPFPGEFRVLRFLAKGAFGAVWQAEDLNLARPVALKTILHSGSSRLPHDKFALLREEARLLASVEHRNVVQVFAWREAPGRDADGPLCYLVLKYVPGGSLADRVREEGPLSWELAARYIADVADGLGEVHARGLVHRDVKPANILWDSKDDEAVLTDFGIAVRLSEPGSTGGTPFYMPPEAFGGHVSPAQDVYGLAATLFWLTTGSVPFPGADAAQVEALARRGLPDTDPRCRDLPAELEQLIRAGLAADPGRRPTLARFAAELRGTLNQLLADRLLPAPEAGAADPHLRLSVCRQGEHGVFVPAAAAPPPPERMLRDLRRVPPRPGAVELHTGDRVRIEVESDRAGFVTVFNVGPTGNLNLLYPDNPVAPAAVTPGRPLHVLDVALTPPAGTERVFALWSREPLPLRLEELASLAAGLPPAGPYRATRDMKRLQESVRELPAEVWEAAVVELNHLPPEDAP
jgi:serine/threonine protein kinase